MDKKNSDIFDELPESKVAVSELQQNASKLLENIAQVVLGKRDVAKLCLVALLADEHVLLEDVPGVGKTLMGKALARSVDGEFRRVQFTPDLLPSDIVGSSIFNSQRAEFEFNEGPIFSNFVLADEINRAPPRTQSALLEAMSDAQVSVDGTTHRLGKPFMVIATQNPFESEGTYVLPESQLDRFLFRVEVGYPDRDNEIDMLNLHSREVFDPQPVTTAEDIAIIQSRLNEVHCTRELQTYIIDLARQSRIHPDLVLGASPRASINLMKASRARALLAGRNYLTHEDIQAVCIPVLAHRLIMRPEAEMDGRSINDVITDVIQNVPVLMDS